MVNPSVSLISGVPNGWLEFIRGFPEATLFHHPAWINTICQCYGYEPFFLVGKDQSGNIIAGVPLVKVTSFFQRKKLISLPFTDHCQPLALNNEDLPFLVSGLVNLLESYNEVELRWHYPGSPQMHTNEGHVLSQVRLDPDPAIVSANIQRKYVRQVQVAQERGVHVELGNRLDQLNDFYRLHTQSRRRHGLPVQPWRYFRVLYHQVVLEDFGFLITAYQAGECVAAGLFLAWNQTLIEKYSATCEAGRRSLAMDLVLWQAICWGCENGMSKMDMGRTDLRDQGLRYFKKRWGAEENPLTYSIITKKVVADSTQHHAGHASFLSFANTLLRRMPVWVCRLTGELFYQYLT
jgi:hypothetical protein